jgi:hypothetical protein
VLGELLAIPDMVAKRLFAPVTLGPGPERPDDTNPLCGGGFGDAGLQNGKLVEFLLGVSRRSKPASVRAELNAMETCQTEPSVVE